MSVFLELREYGWCVAPGLFTYFWPGVYAYLHHDLTTLLRIVYDCLLLGLRTGFLFEVHAGALNNLTQQRVSVISPIGTLTNTLPVKKSGRVNIIPIGDKIMPGEHRYSSQNFNAVPGDRTTQTLDSHRTLYKSHTRIYGVHYMANKKMDWNTRRTIEKFYRGGSGSKLRANIQLASNPRYP